MAATPSILYEFGPFRLDPDRELMLRDGQRLAVTPKAFEVLLVLVRRSHEVVRKDELMRAVWRGRVVEEANLSQAIFLLRKLLGDTRSERRYIVTLPGQGYRFAQDVRTVQPDESEAGVPPQPVPEAAAAAGRPVDAADAPVPARLPVDSGTRRSIRLWLPAGAGVLLVAVVLASGYFIRRHEVAPVTATAVDPGISAPTPFDPPSNTLVVLPFRNLSGDPRQQYFSDGITEELTSALGQNHALTVIAWDAASRFRDSDAPPVEIGKALNVANLLQGSIQRDGDEVRVIAELVSARTGAQLWSAHYDGSFRDIFQVQDQVSQAIAAALRVQFTGSDVPAGGTRNAEAHDLVLKGRSLMQAHNAASVDAGRQAFEAAIALDPDYADAHALLSRGLLLLTELSDLPLKDTLPRIRAEAERAIALDPANADGWVALGAADVSADPPRFADARDAFRKALAFDPSNVAAHGDYGMVLPIRQAVVEEQAAAQLDPDQANVWSNLGHQYMDLENWPQMVKASLALIRLDGTNVGSAFGLAYAYQQLQHHDQMVAAFDLVKPATPLDREQVATGRLVYRAVGDPALRPQALAALKTLRRLQSNPHVAGNLIQMYAALGEHATLLELLETTCLDTPVGCNDLAINPQYAALRGDPRFQALVKQYDTATLQ